MKLAKTDRQCAAAEADRQREPCRYRRLRFADLVESAADPHRKADAIRVQNAVYRLALAGQDKGIRSFIRNGVHALDRRDRDRLAQPAFDPLEILFENGLQKQRGVSGCHLPHVDHETLVRANNALLLTLICGGLAACAIGALIYDLARVFSAL